ncbi:hypothetical protein C8R41DRAFT_827562 [Lentinula lateritia]|uniref:Uncharacterized protein n=1 Tax=Lentinula lateritia TaxID=40482 RepID=A0ABQ8VND4_9AGAR|nr:hypothetical protein C8R41DRAFT_827562 [Lentinula lateritia]
MILRTTFSAEDLGKCAGPKFTGGPDDSTRRSVNMMKMYHYTYRCACACVCSSHSTVAHQESRTQTRGTSRC